MGGCDGRCGGVAGDHDGVGPQGQQPGNPRVQLLQSKDLGLEIAVLAGGVRRLVVDEEKVVA